MSKNGPLIVSSPTRQSRLSVKAKQLIVESDWTVIYVEICTYLPCRISRILNQLSARNPETVTSINNRKRGERGYYHDPSILTDAFRAFFT